MSQIEFCSLDNRKQIISSNKIFYCLPDSGTLHITTNEESIFIDNFVVVIVNGIYKLQVKQKNILIKINDDIYDIHVLSRELSEVLKDKYITFSQHLYENLSNEQISLEQLWKLLQSDDENKRLTICEFATILENASDNSDIDKILELTPVLPHIFHKPKQHLKQIDEVRPAEVVSRVGQDSIRHLASHSEHWKAIKANGLVPERLLAKTLEDDLEIYENKAVKKLVDTLFNKETKEKLSTIEILTQLDEQLDSVFSYEQYIRNINEAQKILWKGILPDKLAEKNRIIEENRIKLTQILNYLVSCKNTKVYRKLNNSKFYDRSLNKTNIFMMDQYYKKAYKLWNLVFKDNEHKEEELSISISNQYSDYVRVILLFSIIYSGFEFVSDSSKAYTRNPEQQHFERKDVELFVDYSNNNELDFFKLSFKKKNTYKIYSADLKIKIPPQFKNDILEENGYFIFTKIFNAVDQNRLIQAISAQWDKKEKDVKSTELRKRFYSTFSNKKEYSKDITIIPWKYGFPDNETDLRELINKLSDLKKDSPYCIVSSNLTTDFEKITNRNLLQPLMNYGAAFGDYDIGKTDCTIIPINIFDMNSYRRFTKLIMLQLIDVESDYCPVCDCKNKLNITSSEYKCMQCGFTIKVSKCSNCQEEFKYSDYKLPKIHVLNDELSPGAETMIDEIHLGFKNITNARIIDGRIHPVCPFCGN